VIISAWPVVGCTGMARSQDRMCRRKGFRVGNILLAVERDTGTTVDVTELTNAALLTT
jgi:hypothetical protein